MWKMGFKELQPSQGAFKASWNSLDARGEAAATDFLTGVSSAGQEGAWGSPELAEDSEGKLLFD